MLSLNKEFKMAISKNNPLTHGASGMIGGTLVFRSWNGKTFMYNRPKKPTKESLVQKENRQKFKMASNFAKRMMQDPLKKEEYKQLAKTMNLPNAYTTAVTEYMRKPEIHSVDLEGYSGGANQEITISASKKGFEIESVEVIVISDKGEVVEQGKATKNDRDKYSYSSKRFVPVSKSLQVLVRARERTGNYVDKKIFKEILD
jgi:hypothetical protein